MSYPPQYPGPPGGFPPGPPGYPPGFPGQEPPKKKRTGLIVGVAIAAVVIIGGVVTLIVLNSGNKVREDIANSPTIPTFSVPPPSGLAASSLHPTGTRGSSSSSSSSSGSSGKSGGSGASSPAALQQAIIDAYTSRSADSFDGLACQTASAADKKNLQDTLDKVPPQVTYSADGAPQVSGTSGTLGFRVDGGPGGQSKTFTLPVTQSGSSWCLS